MPGGDEKPDQGFSVEKLTEGSGDAIFAVAPGGESLPWTAGAAPMAGGHKREGKAGSGGADSSAKDAAIVRQSTDRRPVDG